MRLHYHVQVRNLWRSPRPQVRAERRQDFMVSESIGYGLVTT
jgi:hypothetical protein